MKVNKYLFSAMASLFAFLGTLNAQQTGTPTMVDTLAAREAHFLSVKLKLNLEQKINVYNLTKNNMLQMDSVRRLPQAEAAKINTLSKLAKDYRSALKGVLTPEQYTSYEALITEQKKKFEAQVKNVKELPQ